MLDKFCKKKWYEENKERILIDQKEYRDANKDKERARAARYYQANKERIIKKSLARQKDNPAAARDSAKKWADKNPEAIAIWRKNNIIRRRENEHRRRLSVKTGKGFSMEFIGLLMRDQNNSCNACGLSFESADMAIDHIIPIALGGPHSELNIQLLCKSCNCSKGKKSPIEWAFYFSSTRPFSKL